MCGPRAVCEDLARVVKETDDKAAAAATTAAPASWKPLCVGLAAGAAIGFVLRKLLQ